MKLNKNTYEIFELENGVPTYGYELAQAVKDGYLVDFMSVETTLKFIEHGIVYDELSPEDKEVYEDTFEDENGEIEWNIFGDDVPYDLNAPVIEIPREDYGIWYVDVMENPEQIQGKSELNLPQKY